MGNNRALGIGEATTVSTVSMGIGLLDKQTRSRKGVKSQFQIDMYENMFNEQINRPDQNEVYNLSIRKVHIGIKKVALFIYS